MEYVDEVEIGRRNPNADNHWELLDPDNLDLDGEKPIVFCLSGNGTLQNRDINGFAKQVETNLELLFKDQSGTKVTDKVDIIGVKYAQVKNESTGTLTPEALAKIVRALARKFVDSNGNRYSLDMAKKKMSKITFFTYCAGDQELQRLITSLNNRLVEFGYSKDEVLAINNATINVSFAPYDNISNKIPSLRVVSAKDEVVSDDLKTMMSDEQFDKLNGVYLHREAAGSLYGVQREGATAGNIKIITGNLINLFDGTQDEHNVHLVSRDKQWDVSTYTIDGIPYKSINADCVSQMMAWTLCRAVENSLKNIQSSEYIPNNFFGDLVEELKSIKNSYSKDSLANNPKRMSRLRRVSYDAVMQQKKKELAQQLKDYKPPVSLVIGELKNAKTFDEIMLVCEKYNYYYVEDYLTQVDFLTEDERVTITTAKDKRAAEQKVDSIRKLPLQEQLNKLKSARTYDEIMDIARALGPISEDLLPALMYASEECAYKLTQEEYNQISATLKIEREAKAEKSNKSKSVQIQEDLEMCNKDFKDILRVFESYDYYGADDFVYSVKNYLTREQFDLIRKADKIKRQAIIEKEQFVHVPNFDEMVSKINNARSLDEVIDFVRKNNFVGIEYVLPEVIVLTNEEKDYIMNLAGKTPDDVRDILDD